MPHEPNPVAPNPMFLLCGRKFRAHDAFLALRKWGSSLKFSGVYSTGFNVQILKGCRKGAKGVISASDELFSSIYSSIDQRK
jgi:hypothetical protein